MEFRYGAYPTMITPYKADGSVDLDTAAKYVRWYFQNGCAGIFAVCQSSEIAFLTVEERVALNARVYAEAKALEKEYGRTFSIVSSGHVADSIEAQADELTKIWNSGTDALILITNRLAAETDSDDVWIANAEKLLSLLPPDIPLGLYECPLPYKRLVTEKVLRWCLSTGRFYFMKDTCCNIDMIRERLRLLSGSHFRLMNANCQTLLESMRAGGAGYCGIMCNFHPALYVWLCENYEKFPDLADDLQSMLGTVGFTESGMPYPLTAKYHMCLEGIKTELIARNRKPEELTDYMKDSTAQMRRLSKLFEGRFEEIRAEITTYRKGVTV
jgi:4-hydroxy-tetrahydrodipicolinate synthase